MRFAHPMSGTVVERRLVDVGAGGFAFAPEPALDVLWLDLPLREVELDLPGITVRPPAAVIRSLGPARVGVEMQQVPAMEEDHLRRLVLTRRDPALVFHDGEDLEAVLRLHRQVGLLEPAMDANLHSRMDRTALEWKSAHCHPEGLVRTVVGQKDGEVLASLNLIRAYDRGWCLQHGAVLHPGVRPTAGEMYSALLTLVCGRDDGEYLSAFIAAGARSQHAVMDAFFTAHSTPEHRGRLRFWLYTAPTESAQPRDVRCRRMTGAEEELVEHAALRLLDPICARALGLRQGEILLPASREAFMKAGLVRGREAWGAFVDGTCVAVLLREWSSPGLCLSSVLSAAMVLPVRPQLDPNGEATTALVRLARMLPLHADPPQRLLFLPEGVDDAPVVAAGFTRTAGCCLYAFHRFGLREYHRYVSARYTFVHARLGMHREVGA